jgi:membrane-bound ClpP family serine protease
MVGREGVVQVDLQPEGVVLVAAEEWSARSTAGPLPKGTRVRVVAVDRLTLGVEPIEREASAVSEPEGGKA